MIKKIIIFYILLMTFSKYAAGQTNNSPCSVPESAQFDFWVGEWELSWKGTNGEDLTGANKITKILDGCVIQENFLTADGSFKGTSVSLYNVKLGKWQQTWVDNGDSYLDFTGEFKDGKMILTRDSQDKDGNPIKARMVFFNIMQNEFDWNWEKSNDGGINWTLLWKIHYKRKT